MSLRVLSDVIAERQRQHARYGWQQHPDGTGGLPAVLAREAAQRECDDLTVAGLLTWRAILAEEVAEAFAEVDHDRLREELIQVAAVAVQWIEALDRR